MNNELRVMVLAGSVFAAMSFAGQKPAPMPAATPTVAQPAQATPEPARKKAAQRPARAAPKAKQKPAQKKRAASFCDVVRREYARMTWAQRMAAYSRATPEQIAAGRRCLGL